MQPKRPGTQRNHLAGETSPYLLQHADNPVQWYPWGEAALARARAENKPILLSIGYSACHWCHVMAHESFEDPVTAEVMNRLFVNVKVDREERPDLDRIYQTAHQVLNQGGGGWPLTVFLSPQTHRPFFTGTYFPNEPRHGMPPFKLVLERVAEFYRTREADLADHGEKLVTVLGDLLPPPDRGSEPLSRDVLASARETLQREFDGRFGGFGQAPKFPHPMNLEFLLRTWRATAEADEPDLQALFMATLTLTRMAEGGLYDQLGGGFCRYSVDPYWMIPHFEKMLYDNGQLLAVSAQAAVATGDALYRRITAETADWLLREMEHPAGGFYATLDADSEGHEGRFYVWEPAEVQDLLTPEEYAVFAARFGLDRGANFEGKWHLHCYQSMTEIATALGLAEDAATELLDSARAKLLDYRNGRVWPGRDEKILTSWNGLAIAGLAAAARALDVPGYAEAAARAVRCLREHAWYRDRLFAVHKDGRTRFPAYLDDHAFLAWGLTELVQARWDGAALAWAIELADAGRQRHRGAPAGAAGLPAGRASLPRCGREDAACGDQGRRALPARPHQPADGAGRVHVPADDRRAARPAGRRGYVAPGVGQVLRPAAARAGHSCGDDGTAGGARRQEGAGERHGRLRVSRYDLLGTAGDAGRSDSRTEGRLTRWVRAIRP